MTDQMKSRLTFLVNAAYVSVILLIIYMVYNHLLALVFPFVLAFMIVSLINPLIRTINSRFPKRRSFISFALMLLLYITIGLLLFLGIVTLIFWLRDLVIDFSDNYYADVLRPNLISLWNGVGNYIHQLPDEWQMELQNFQGNLMRQAQNMVVGFSQNFLGWVSGLTGQIPGFLIAFIFTIMLSFFISVQYEDVLKFFKTQLPERAVDTLKELRSILGKTVFRYLRAVFILILITWGEVAVGLALIGMERPILIGLAIAIFDALPVFGTGAIVIPWSVISLLQGNYHNALGLIILYGVVLVVRQMIEPKIVGDTLGINPIVSIVAIYFGFKVFGVFGMIFMPMTAYILLELHRRGKIKLFQTAVPVVPEQEKSTDSGVESADDL